MQVIDSSNVCTNDVQTLIISLQSAEIQPTSLDDQKHAMLRLWMVSSVIPHNLLTQVKNLQLSAQVWGFYIGVQEAPKSKLLACQCWNVNHVSLTNQETSKSSTTQSCKVKISIFEPHYNHFSYNKKITKYDVPCVSKLPEHFSNEDRQGLVKETHLVQSQQLSLHPRLQEMLAISLVGAQPPLQPAVEWSSTAQVHRRQTSTGMAAFYSWDKFLHPVCVDGASSAPRSHHLHPPISFISTQSPQPPHGPWHMLGFLKIPLRAT